MDKLLLEGILIILFVFLFFGFILPVLAGFVLI